MLPSIELCSDIYLPENRVLDAGITIKANPPTYTDSVEKLEESSGDERKWPRLPHDTPCHTFLPRYPKMREEAE